MLKRERLLTISEMVNKKGILTVNEIMDQLKVSDMTVRRDLDELEKSGKLLRVHGGAQSLTYTLDQELSHTEKSVMQIEEKQQIAAAAARLINDGDTIFLGPGTTIELLASFLIQRRLRIITNNYAVFEVLAQAEIPEILLIGGDFRKNTGAFVGPITNENLRKLKFTKAFISSNGVHNEAISTYSTEEGEAQQIALNNSKTKYLLVDNQKFNRDDFYVFYNLHDLDLLITDHRVSPRVKEHYSQYVHLKIAEPLANNA
ncbi:DeoR family transcriptional regulator, lactose phosphotransferase system repressor [Enterococcus sp. 10A9_DIV0425]|uniref:Lactose phosphotransferase system repressor n=1 Tax=Candidatus Enterococcus wittei TaxID=1987383 RepID=A0A2C9XPY2_9ENTE|nr:DeoR/GlpR family DNA-binding transcription regulator [Enterococcus sp. 10A9_DIV0425]OTP12240.1 DeoR family transcriptional regulator, lactose phosphotransferase system repressor [Enterococcus sp. 10A9_DIV0425]THE13372.1 DeoR/GlpR transcriptional regulator [Enterococcus hirae]